MGQAIAKFRGTTGGSGSSGPLTLTLGGNQGTVSQPFSTSLVASGGSQPYTFSIASGASDLTAAGLSLNTSTGAITGTPSAAGAINFTGKVVDAASTTVTITCTIVISAGGSGSSTPPLAPNITSATCTVGYQCWGNAVEPYFSGVITVPTTDPAYPNLCSIWVYAVSPSGVSYFLCSYAPPVSGNTINYSGSNNAVLQTASAQAGWSIRFVCENSQGLETPSPYSVTGLTIAAPGNLPAIATITGLAEVGSRYQNPPGGNTYTQIQATINWASAQPTIPTYTVWRGFNNGTTTTWQWVGWQQGQLGSTSVITDSFFIPLGSNTYVLAAVAGTYPPTVTAPPSYAIQSSTSIPMSIGNPTPTAPTLSVTNIAGQPVTQSNIYMGLNANSNPWAEVLLAIQTPGNSDTATYFYDVWCAWTDASGNLVNPGGVSNTQGWQNIGQPANSGKMWTYPLMINYPSGNYYLTVVVYARTRNSTGTAPPFTGDAGATACVWPGGNAYYRIPVGQAPSSGLTVALSNGLGVPSQPFSASIQGVGGVAPYTYSVPATYSGNPNALPAWLTLNGTQLTGAHPTLGQTQTAITVTDSTGATATVQFTFTITNGPMIVTFPGTQAMVGQPYTATAKCVGGLGGYTFAVSVGSLPAGLSLNASTGAITGTPTAAGTSAFTIQATDSISEQGSANFSITVVGGSLAVSVSAPPAVVNQPYTATLTPTGGVQPYSFALASGTLPGGLALSATGANSGLISGTPTASGKSGLLKVTVTDANGSTASVQFYILVTSGALAGSFNGGVGATIGSAFSAQVFANGGVPAYTYAVQGGTTKPSWLALDSNGLLSGTPTATGSVSFGVTITDAVGSTTNVAIAFSVGSTTALAPNLSTAPTVNIGYQCWGNAIVPVFSGTITLPTGAANYAQLALVSIYAVGPAGSYLIAQVPPGGGSTVSYSGWNSSILQTAAAQSGWSLQFVCSNAAGVATPSPYNVGSQTIAAAGNLPAISSVTIAETGSRYQNPPGGNTYTQVQVTVTFSGSQATIPTFTLWQSMNGGTTKSWVGWYQGSVGTSSSATLTFFIPLGSNSFVVYALAGTYGSNIAAPPVISAANTSNTLPLSIGNASPTAATLGITNISGAAPTQSNIYMGVNSAQNPYAEVYLTIATPGNTDTSTYFYDVWLEWTDASGNPVNPGGVSNTQGWQHFGQPANSGAPWQGDLKINYPAGDYYLTIQVWAVTRNDNSTSTSTPPFTGVTGRTLCQWPGGNTYYRLHVGQPPASALNLAASASGMTGIAGQPFSGQLSASGGAGPYTWAITTGTLPSWASLNTSTGAITGTPTGGGSTPLTATVTDQAGNHATVNFTITVTGGSLALVLTNASGSVGQTYTGTLQASGGVGSYTYSISGQPSWLILGSNGALSGIPSAAGSVTFSATVSDSAGNTVGPRVFTLFIGGGQLALTFSGAGGYVNQSYLAGLMASGGSGTYSYSINDPTDLPPGVSLTQNAGMGSLSGTPTTAGQYGFTAKVTDGTGATATCACQITIAGGLLIITFSGPAGLLKQAYSANIHVQGGVPNYTFTTTPYTGSLPPGLSLSSSGVISGTPTSTGSYTFSVTATDSAGNVGHSGNFTIIINGAGLSCSLTAPLATVGTAYSAQLSASGGVPGYTFALQTGNNLPTGLSLNASTGVISGTPSASGSTGFYIVVTDSAGNTAQSPLFTITVGVQLATVQNVSSPFTCNVGYQFQGNGVMATFSGTVTLPSSTTNLQTIQVNAVSPSGTVYPLNSYNGPFTAGATLNFSGANQNILQTASAQTGWSIQFVSYNASGMSPLVPFSITGITIVALGNTPQINACTITNNGYSQPVPSYSTYAAIQIQTTFAQAQTTSGQWTVWESFDGGSTWNWVNWYAISAGNSTATATLQVIVPVGTSNFKVAVAPGAYQSGTNPPAYAVMSNTLSLAIGNPSGTTATLGLVNVAGNVATTSNIFAGVNSLGNPFFILNLQVATPGSGDPTLWYFDVWCAWCDASGNVLNNPGGVANSGGWQHWGKPANTGKTETLSGAPGWNYAINAQYMVFQVWACTRNDAAGSSWTPASGAVTGRTQVQWTGGATQKIFQVGYAPGGWNQGTSQNTNIQASLLTDPSFEFSLPGAAYTSVSGVVTEGPGYLNPMWQINSPGNDYSYTIVGTGGNSGSNYCKLTGTNAALMQTFAVQPGLPLYVQVAIMNSGATSANSLSVYIYWYTAAGVFISPSGNVGAVSNSITAWQTISGMVTAPAAAATATVVIGISGGAGVAWFIDDVYVQQVLDQTTGGTTQTTQPSNSQPSGFTVENGTDWSYYGNGGAQFQKNSVSQVGLVNSEGVSFTQYSSGTPNNGISILTNPVAIANYPSIQVVVSGASHTGLNGTIKDSGGVSRPVWAGIICVS